MSHDDDLENHPTQVSYNAGVKLAKRKPNLDDATVRASARNAEDSEAFVDGYYNTVNR